MKKKILMATLLVGALSLGSCVDDNESASVTAVRNAKAEQLKAVAALSNAQAEAALITANAQAAWQNAEAAYYNAQAAVNEMSVAEREFALQKAKEQYALDIETIKLQAEFDLKQLQDRIADYEDSRLTAEYSKLDNLYNNYWGQLRELTNLKYDLIDRQARLAQLEAGVVSAAEWNKYYTIQSEQQIAIYEAILAVLQDETYARFDNAELEAQLRAKSKELQLAEIAFADDPTCAALLATGEPAKKAAQTLHEQTELLDKISYIIECSNYDSKSYEVYSAVNYNTTTTESGYEFYRVNARINETNKLQQERWLAQDVENNKTNLGTSTDTKDKNTAYGRLAKANDDLTTAEAALKTAEAMPETTDAEKAAKENAIINAENAISLAEEAVASAKDNLNRKLISYEEAVARQEEYNEALAAVDITAFNKAVANFEAAVEAQEEAKEAWEGAKIEATKKIRAEYEALWSLTYGAATDINSQIALYEARIAAEKESIESYKYNNDNSERTLEQAKVDIEELEARIEAKTKVVEAAKAALDAALASDDEE